MSFWDCVQRAMDDPDVAMNREHGERAQAMWSELADAYERQGYTRHNAEALAAEDVKTAFKRQNAEQRHVWIAQISAMRRNEARLLKSKRLETVVTDALEHAANSTNREASLIGQQRALVRQFHHKLRSVIRHHSRDLLGNVRDPAKLRNVVRELHGESTGDHAAYALADAVRQSFEDMRLMFNEAGGIIGKLENWGLPHRHNRLALRKAGFDDWAAEIAPRIAWDKMEDHVTGRPLAEPGDAPAPDVQQRVLREVYGNVVFGKFDPDQMSAPRGESLWRRRSHERVLPFRSADDWIAYNKRFGSGDPFASIIGHAHTMARDIALIRTFGPDPIRGYETFVALAMQRAKEFGNAQLASKIEGSADHGRRMLNIYRGSLVPAGPMQQAIATFMSTTRHVLTAALLDRAVIAAVSDTNSMRMAAKAVGMNSENVLSRHVKLMADQMSREEAARAGWIADTLADPGLALSRFQSEVPPAEFAERLSSGVLRIQGLAHWTDQARTAFQMEFAGLMAANAGKSLSEVQPELRGLLQDKGITDAEWQAFTAPETLFTAGNGATFASPIHWREVTDMPSAQADDLFLRIQAMIEEQTEFAVPTNSTWARAFIEGAMPPGSIGYELAKSGLMFKSFAMTFTVNQVRRTLAQQSLPQRIAYGLDLAAGATITGALGLQLYELASGNDPRDMTQPEFWAASALRGGAFGIMGDMVDSASKPYRGLGEFAAGPMLGLGQDVANLTGDAMSGDGAEFAEKSLRFVNRYLPGGDLPLAGLALDRMFLDQLMMTIDPEAMDALMKQARKRPNAPRGSWWMPGSPAPQRAPDLTAVLPNK
ncbi:MAG: hypothetical protein R8G60_15260 [Roseovarius pacificus]|nr:hypothetical protein [Roseovarius pacificus]